MKLNGIENILSDIRKNESINPETGKMVQEVYKGKHGQSDKEYADSRSQGGKMVSGDSKQSGAEYTHGRRVKAANPGMQPDVGGKTKPKSQGKMDAGTRADLKYRKANLKKEDIDFFFEDWVDEYTEEELTELFIEALLEAEEDGFVVEDFVELFDDEEFLMERMDPKEIQRRRDQAKDRLATGAAMKKAAASSASTPASRADKVKGAMRAAGSALKSGIKRAGKSLATNAGKAVGTFQGEREASRIKAKRTSMQNTPAKGGSDSSSSDSTSTVASAKTQNAARAKAKQQKGSGLGTMIKRGVKKVVGKTSRVISKGADKVATRLGEEVITEGKAKCPDCGGKGCKHCGGKGYHKTHDCSKKVEHAEWGVGECIYGQHAIPDAEGQVAWYDVMFEHGVEKNVPMADMQVLVSEAHSEHVHHQEEMVEGYGKKSKKTAIKVMPKKEELVSEKLDPVGKEDGDVNNDGKKDSSDKYLMNRRKTIAKKLMQQRTTDHDRKRSGMQSEEHDNTKPDPKKTAEKKARLEKKRGMKLDDHPEYKKEEVEQVDEAAPLLAAVPALAKAAAGSLGKAALVGAKGAAKGAAKQVGAAAVQGAANKVSKKLNPPQENEGYEPGKVDQKIKTDRAGYRIPQADADAAKKRLLAKAAAKRKAMKEEALDENRRAARAAGGYKDDSKKQPDPSKAGFTGVGNMSIDAIRKMSARIEKEKSAKK